MIDFEAAGLGLQYEIVQLVPARSEWATIAQRLAGDITVALTDVVTAVEHVGSTSVPGLLAKPIVDLAIGLRPGTDIEAVTTPMQRLGWISRGDAGDDGGWVFVLEDAPWHRVAHAHGVVFGGRQWTNYLRFRELLRTDAVARRSYEATKQHLAELHPDGRREYQRGKEVTVERLLRS